MRAVLTLVLVTLLAPVAVADNIFTDSVCTFGLPCVTPVVCVPRTLCQETTCSPVATCEARTIDTTDCKLNQTIDGQTCQQSRGFEARQAREGQEIMNADAVVLFSHGGVSQQNLRNAWVSDSAEVGVQILGIDMGRVSVVYYNSTIQTSNENEARQHGVGVSREDGTLPVGQYGATAGVILFDGTPEDCFVRTSTGLRVECSDQLP